MVRRGTARGGVKLVLVRPDEWGPLPVRDRAPIVTPPPAPTSPRLTSAPDGRSTDAPIAAPRNACPALGFAPREPRPPKAIHGPPDRAPVCAAPSPERNAVHRLDSAFRRTVGRGRSGTSLSWHIPRVPTRSGSEA